LNTISEKSIAWLNEKIDQVKKVAVISHRNPDGDALGSSLALRHYLKQKGIVCTLIVPNSFPDYYNWMPGIEEVINHEDNKIQVETTLPEQELIFFLDFNDLAIVDTLEA